LEKKPLRINGLTKSLMMTTGTRMSTLTKKSTLRKRTMMTTPERRSPTTSHAGHDHGEFDPHFWFDMERMALGAELIGAELAVNGDESFASCGESVAAEIRAS
jgi:ABC-type Zn uptake system ZnuABC Zn-binding protein ZnuA